MITVSFVNPEAYTYLQTLSVLLPSENKAGGIGQLKSNCTFATVFGVILLHTITVQCMLLRTESIEFLLLLPENPFLLLLYIV